MKKIWLLVIFLLLVSACDTGKIASKPYPKSRDKVLSPVAPKTTVVPIPTTISPSTTIVIPGPTGTTTTTTTRPTTTTVPPTTTQPTLTIRVRDYGAIPDDLIDDQAAIQRALDSAPAGYTVLFEKGIYLHSGSLRVTKSNVVLSGYGTTLRGTTPSNQALIVRANNVSVNGFSIVNVTNSRLSTEEQTGISISFSDSVTVRDVTIDGTSSAGILIWESTNYSILNNTVKNTLSDGIHSTGNSKFGLVQGNYMTNPGDDCYAVVGYNAELPSNITIQNNYCSDGKARGISVVGGQDILIQNNTIDRSAAAGILVASEDSYNTNFSRRVRIIGNLLTNVNTNANIVHGGIFLIGRSGFVTDDILVENNTVKDTIVGPAHLVILTGYVTNVRFVNNKTEGTKQHSYIESNSYTMSGDTHNGVLI